MRTIASPVCASVPVLVVLDSGCAVHKAQLPVTPGPVPEAFSQSASVLASAGINQLGGGETKHPSIVSLMRIYRVSPMEIRPSIVIAPYADDPVDWSCSMWNQR